MLHKGPLSGCISFKHRAKLWHGDVTFIDYNKEVFWKVIKKTMRR